MFAECVNAFHLTELNFKPYSLRRGGATHGYIQQGVLEAILLRGRWHSLAVARLYLEDGLAQLPNLKLPPPSLHRLRSFAYIPLPPCSNIRFSDVFGFVERAEKIEQRNEKMGMPRALWVQ